MKIKYLFFVAIALTSCSEETTLEPKQKKENVVKEGYRLTFDFDPSVPRRVILLDQNRQVLYNGAPETCVVRRRPMFIYCIDDAGKIHEGQR